MGPLDTAVWTARDQIAVVAWGSSGCPRLPTHLDVADKDTIDVTMTVVMPPPGVSCPADLNPTTSILLVPRGINIAQQVDVRIRDGNFSSTVSLPPQTGTT
jgi:hypothetical protein